MNCSHSYKHGNSNFLAINFINSVKSFPDNNAIYINGVYYTYKQLLDISINIYNQIPKGKLYNSIAFYSNDSVFDYAAIIAINLYGAAYVPLNNKFPENKNIRIINESNVDLLISFVEVDYLNPLSIQKIKITNEILESKVVLNDINVDLFQKVHQPIAYILFTSGSTGVPKGVPVSFENCFSFFSFFFKNYDFNQKDKFLQVYELTFDVSVFSFFMPIQLGACCYVVPNNGIKFITIAKMLFENLITVVSMVPSTIWHLKKYFKEINLPELRYSFFSGDILNYSLAKDWKQCFPNGELHNFYGPTETTIVCTRYVWDGKKSKEESINDIVPLGKPFSGMEYVICDEDKNITKKGELCFSGFQVVKKYLNNANEDSFFIKDGKRFYKTGDIVSVNENGDLIFYGRVDNQVKINGYRVELGEIKAIIEKYLSSKAIVDVRKNTEGVNEIIAFVTDSNKDEAMLRNILEKELPTYMLPSKIIFVEDLPYTLNGKVDKNKLMNLV